MTRGKNARERHNEKQLMRVLSHALSSKMRSLVGFGLSIHPAGHLVTIKLVDRYWVRFGVERSLAARNRKRK